MRTYLEGLDLWKRLSDTPTDNDMNIDEDFTDFDGTVIFEKGTECEEIWHWFEETFDDFIVGNVMYGKY